MGVGHLEEQTRGRLSLESVSDLPRGPEARVQTHHSPLHQGPWWLFTPALWRLSCVLTSLRLRALVARVRVIGEQTAVCSGHPGKGGSA